MENEKVYRINSKRFICFVMLHFDTVKNFCKVAGISRQRFYFVLNKTYKNKEPETFTRLFNCLNDSLEDGKYDYELFWRSI